MSTKDGNADGSAGGDAGGEGGSEFIYHERQLGGLCGVHCLNNLLQAPLFGPGDLAEIGVQLDQEERQLLGEAEQDGGQPYNVDPTADGGNFSIQVLVRALKKYDVELLPAKHPDGRNLMKDPPTATEAFLCQYKDHWFAVRKLIDCWWNLNSTRKRPGLVSPFYLSVWLAQLTAEGYSIFLLRGSSLPLTTRPSRLDTKDETFHSFFDLLEQAKSSKDKPIAGGEGNDDDDEAANAQAVVDADAANAQAIADAQSADHDAAVIGIPVAGLAGAAPQSAWMQSQVWPPPQTAQVWPQPQIAQAQPSWLACQVWPSQQVTQLPGYGHVSLPSSVPFAHESSSSAPSRGRGGRPGSNYESADMQSLREMGFRDPQIRAAMELCSQRVSDASSLLMRVTVDAGIERDGRRLAQEVQDAVFGLDCDAVRPEAVLRLVTLLSLGEAPLRAAAAHADPQVMTEVLLSTLQKRGDRWSPGLVSAFSVAVELLASAPQAGGADAPPAVPPKSMPPLFQSSARPCNGSPSRAQTSSTGTMLQPGGDDGLEDNDGVHFSL